MISLSSLQATLSLLTVVFLVYATNETWEAWSKHTAFDSAALALGLFVLCVSSLGVVSLIKWLKGRTQGRTRS